MKKIVFTILLSLLTLSSFAQNDSLYVDGMKWVTSSFTFGNEIEVEPVCFTYVINGDSLISGNRYKKMLCFLYDPLDKSEFVDSQDGICYDTFFCRYDDGKHLFYLPEYKDSYYSSNFIGDDYLFFDENFKPGDVALGTKIGYIGDTIFESSADIVRKCWKLEGNVDEYSRYLHLNKTIWVDGVGSLSQPIPYIINDVDCACYHMLLYCINPAGDTIYRNQKYIDLVEPYFKTDIPALKSSAVSFSQRGGECVVTLPYDASSWSATLYNSVGAAVARRSGEGSEIVLPATSKGTHILVVNADGRVVKKKVFIK